MPKEVNEISKLFKKNNQSKEKNIIKRTYAQALLSSSNVKEILKIRETFSNLQVNKIKNIQKVINNNGKLKPCINITMKDLFRKQVIILMNNENKTKFMEALSGHITNLN